jgi:hypothetical protein
MTNNENKIKRTNIVSSTDLDRYEGTVKIIRQAWDTLPEDIEPHEREMFVEIAGKILILQETLRESEKDRKNIN